MSSTLIISKSNPIRLVITQLEGLNPRSADNRLFKDMGAPFFDQSPYFKPVEKTDPIGIQVVSSFDTNSAKIRSYGSDAIVTDNILPVSYDFGGNSYKQFVFDVSGLDEGDYYLQILGSHADLKTYNIVSEPFRLRTTWNGTVLISYYNNEANFDVFYPSGLTFYSRVSGRFIKPADNNEAEIFDNDARELSMLSGSVTHARMLELFRVAAWEVLTINRALSHDYVDIDGERVVSGNRLPTELGDFSFLASPKAALSLREGNFTNTHDSDDRVLIALAPSNLQASLVSADEVALTWDDISNTEISYTVQRATAADFLSDLEEFEIAADSESYNDDYSIAAETTYYYRVKAVGTTFESEWSNTATILTPLAFGNALRLDGNNDFIDLSSSGLGGESLPDSWSYSLWFRHDYTVGSMSTLHGNRLLLIGTTGGSNQTFQLQFVNDPTFGYCFNVLMTENAGATQNDYIAQEGGTFDNDWHHFVVTREKVGTNYRIRCYLDGALKSWWPSAGGYREIPETEFDQLDTYPASILIGGSSRSWLGCLNEISFIHKRLSLSEVQELYNEGGGAKPTSLFPETKLYLRLNESSGTNTVDESGNGYDGTLTNFAGTFWIDSDDAPLT